MELPHHRVQDYYRKPKMWKVTCVRRIMVSKHCIGNAKIIDLFIFSSDKSSYVLSRGYKTKTKFNQQRD